jgi:hypothetical protein
MNRLHRLNDLTGLDLTQPHDAALFLVTTRLVGGAGLGQPHR